MYMIESRRPGTTLRGLLLAAASLLALPAMAAENVPTLPDLQWVPCWFTPPEGRRADCARFTLAQDSARPEGLAVVLPLVVYRSETTPLQADPVVVLGGGGPGNAVGIEGEQANDWWQFLDRLALDAGRDVVVVDQRGAGMAEPSLACEWGAEDAADALAQPAPVAQHLQTVERVLTRCRKRLLAAGVDLSRYDADTAASDFEALRVALGVERWNLYGTSYAARIALSMLRHYPQGVRSAILDSAVTPEARFYEESPLALERAFEALFSACRADAACSAYYPDTRAAFARVMQRLRRHPLTITVAWPETLAPFEMQIDDERLVEILFQTLYDSASSARLPLVIQALDRGSSDLLAPFARNLVKQYLARGWSDGLYYAAMCREELPFNDIDTGLRMAAREPLFAAFNQRWLRSERTACALWQVTPADPSVEQPVSTDTPVLVLAGGLDPVTPPAWGKAAAAQLANAWFQEFPAVGHDVIGSDDCALDVASGFLVDPRRDPRRLDCVRHPAPVYFDLDY